MDRLKIHGIAYTGVVRPGQETAEQKTSAQNASLPASLVSLRIIRACISIAPPLKRNR
jgi:hypothetical protein